MLFGMFFSQDVFAITHPSNAGSVGFAFESFNFDAVPTFKKSGFFDTVYLVFKLEFPVFEILAIALGIVTRH